MDTQMTRQPTEPTPGPEPSTVLQLPTARDLARLFWTTWPFDTAQGSSSEEAASSHPIRLEEAVEEGQLVIRAELPGLDPDKDIEVVVEDNALTIHAERHQSVEDRDSNGYRTEFRYGRFLRRVPLPPGTSVEVVSASYRDGVLEVRMPAAPPQHSARRIAVDRG